MILNDIQAFLNQLFSGFDWDFILFIGLGFEILMAIFFIIKSHYAYEMRMVRKLLQLNTWLNKNQFIDSNNLLEFNNLMKRTPKLLRYHWHQYMLYREKEPSFYMSPYNCIEKPLKTSSFKSNILNFIAMSNAVALIILIFSLMGLGTAELTFTYISKVLATPIIIVFLNTVFTLILRARENVNLSAFYQYFYYFNRFMDKAVTTMPEYVDFEVLFTKSEIKRGIPVLNEYLEKRARQEQEELEKARLNAVEHENFDFSSVGTDGTLVLERAMKETETYINIRQRLLSEIQQLESEIESIKRNYENTQKDYQKKMQTSKENVDRLRKQQEETTNRIENNYIKKQQSDEIKKQEQLEKDHDTATIRFNQEMESLTTEIATRRTDLEEKRQYVEDAMKAEYQTFSTKMYKSVVAVTEERNQEEKDTLVAMKDEIAEQLEESHFKIAEKEKENQELKGILEKNHIVIGEHGGFFSKKLQAEAKLVRRGKKKKGGNDDDETAKESSKIEELQALQAILEPKEKEPAKEEIVYDENGGYFDKLGNYIYKNGAYFDPQGIYHDEFGGWYEADGVTYHPAQEVAKAEIKQEPIIETAQKVEPKILESEIETDLKKVEPEIAVEPQVETQPEIAEQETSEEKFVSEPEIPAETEQKEIAEPELDKNGAYYDANGNYVYPNKGYYDPQGNFHDLKGGWYEPDGTTYHEPESENQEIVVKKKAGRPRKIVAGEPIKEKKPRGRPKKIETENIETEKPKKRGRPKKVESEDAEKPKGKRGRPKKAESGDAESKGTGKRGRPRKVEAETETEKPKGKRGRPAKTENKEGETAKPKKAGRPKKVKAETEKTATISRGRGRPKKETVDEIQILNEKIEDENRKLEEHQKQLKNQLNEALSQLNEAENNDNIDNE